jgi:membrane protein implicated in regulation of membrane protease activity
MLLYFIIMAVGITLLLATLVLGELVDVFDFGLDFGDGAGPFSGPVLGIGLTAFGATGMLTRVYDWPSFLGAITSGLSALAFGALGWWMLALVHRQTGSTDQTMTSMAGRLGEVTTRIAPDGIGEVLLTTSDSTRHVLARSRDGTEISPGTVVRVVQTVGGSVIVEPAFAQTSESAEQSAANSAEA